MKPGKVNSHIQMPRFLLARFENAHHSFYYFDVEKRFIGIKQAHKVAVWREND